MAGSGAQGFSGDGGPALNAALNTPIIVAVDGSGSFYIADSVNHRVRKVDPNGIISTFAGTGTAGFSGDGGQATAAQLNNPIGLAFDSAGNLYICDTGNSRIRKVNTAGIITTIAGNGTFGFSGDGGPAVNASLWANVRVALDVRGNLFIADQNNHRIRKIDTAGIITTVAGSGPVGPTSGAFSGDGGPATSARFQHPTALAVDAAGNIYVSDQLNRRVRKVDTAGIINTIGGNGQTGFSGDGGPAVNASINDPAGIAVDAIGNVYVGDNANNRVRRISPAGIITTAVGNGSAGFSGDGGPATSASINNPFGVTTDAAGDLYIVDVNNVRVRKVSFGAPPFLADPAAISFTAPVTSRVVTVSSATVGTQWTAQVSTQSGGNWLSVSPTSGTAPGSFLAATNASLLGGGTYTGTITVSSSQGTQLIPVTLRVPTTTSGGFLEVEPGSLTFETVAGSNPAPQTVSLTGTLVSVQTSTVNGGSWLSLAQAGSNVHISANVAGLAAGVYSGQIIFFGLNEQVTVRVSLVVVAPAPSILLSRRGLLFQTVAGGLTRASQTFAVVNAGAGSMDWTAQATGTGVSVSPTSGTSIAGSATPPQVTVSVNTLVLAAGQDTGQIRVSAAGASNTPQSLTVILNALAQGSLPPPIVQPSGLLFSAAGTQDVSVVIGVSTVQANVGVQTLDGGTWLDAQPRTLSLTAGTAGTFSVQATPGSLAPGVYRGAVTIQFSDGSPAQLVSVLLLVPPTSEPAKALRPVFACTPQKLVAVTRTLGANFTSPVGWPSPIEVRVADDCGTAVPNASVVASFSNGDAPLVLTSLRNGLYSATWQPVATSSDVTVSVRASVTGLINGTVVVQGRVSNNPGVPALFGGCVVNAASFAPGGAVAPGGIVSAFGRNLALGPNSAARVPLDTSLGGVTVNIGGVDAPLFFSSDGQVNAQLPFDLPANTRVQAVARARNILALPEMITISAVQPGCFTTNQQGTGQGAILNTRGVLVDRNAPAAAGEVVQVFCTGLGITNPAVASGGAAPGSEPLARTVTAVEARIGGRAATVSFSGLAPGFVGLYQVNVQSPTGITAANDVPLVLIQNGVPSNTVTLAIR